MTVDIRRSHDRFHTEIDWLDSWHSFSFSTHYDPANTHHGLLLVNNDDVIRAGSGFPTHAHRDMEIVTWVLEGELEHRDSTGAVGRIYPGLAQRMSAGRGIRHSEANPSRTEDLHLVQMWVLPDTEGVEPGYEERDLTGELERGGLVAVASGKDHDGAVRLHQHGATLWAGRLDRGEIVDVPEAPHVHVFVAKGRAKLDGATDAPVELETGDAARLTDAGERTLTALEQIGAEVLIWETA